jgi:predicted regulator of Ras-like GTPase activity (Roadblock/LC7/MglB family)
MDAAQALADLTEISSQIEQAVLFGEQGEIEASTLSGDRAQKLAQLADELLREARSVGEGGDGLTQLEVSTRAGSVFLVADGERRIVATTGPEPTVGLVFYDLKSCLRAAAEDTAPAETGGPRRSKREA